MPPKPPAGSQKTGETLVWIEPLNIHLPLLLPLASAALYAAAAIFIKVAISRGTSSWAVTFWSNFSIGTLFLPVLFLGPAGWHLSSVPWALLAGILFFAGQIATFRSLASGDVSIATPALASKVVFVALMSLALPGNRPDPDLWLAVFLTMAGVLLLHRGPVRHLSHPMVTAAWALLAALAFAATDVTVQVAAPRAGFTLFMPVMFGTVALLSVPLLLPRMLRAARSPVRAGGRFWGTAGIVLLALQSAGVAAAIGIYGDATGVNVVYSSRGLWSLLLLALFARHLGVAEAGLGRGTFLMRIAGSILILTAVVIVLL